MCNKNISKLQSIRDLNKKPKIIIRKNFFATSTCNNSEINVFWLKQLRPNQTNTFEVFPVYCFPITNFFLIDLSWNFSSTENILNLLTLNAAVFFFLGFALILIFFKSKQKQNIVVLYQVFFSLYLFLCICNFWKKFNIGDNEVKLVSSALNISFDSTKFGFSIEYLIMFCFLVVLCFLQLKKINKYWPFSFFLLAILAFLFIIFNKTIDFFFFFISFVASNFIIYNLLILNKTAYTNHEAVLKYFYISIVSTSLFSYAIWLILELCQSGLYAQVNLLSYQTVLFNVIQPFFNILLIILLVVLFFKLGAFPCHFWTPEIYQGCNWVYIYIIGVYIKIIFIFILLKWTTNIFIFQMPVINLLLLISSFFSIIFGALGAIYERRLTSFFAYTSINSIGIILTNIGINTFAGGLAVIYFIIIYWFTSSLWLFHLCYLNYQTGFVFLDQLKFIKSKSFFLLLSMIICFFSFAGIPVFAGFFSKYLILSNLLIDKSVFLVFVILLTSLLSTFYYIYIIKQYLFYNVLSNFKIVCSPTAAPSFFYYFMFFLSGAVFVPPALVFSIKNLYLL